MEVELDLSLLLVAGFVSVIKVVGTVAVVDTAVSLMREFVVMVGSDATVSVTVTVNTGVAVVKIEAVTTRSAD